MPKRELTPQERQAKRMKMLSGGGRIAPAPASGGELALPSAAPRGQAGVSVADQSTMRQAVLFARSKQTKKLVPLVFDEDLGGLLLTSASNATLIAALQAINSKLLLDSHNRLKMADAVHYTPVAGVALGTGDTLIYTAAAKVKARVVIANVSAAARTFQLCHGTISDANSLFKNTPLVIGETLLWEVDLANGDVLRGLCDSASGVTVRLYVYTIS